MNMGKKNILKMDIMKMGSIILIILLTPALFGGAWIEVLA